MKILIVAGGSGGHVFPAVALSQELAERKDVEIIFAASKRALDKKILEGTPFKKVFLSINPMPYGIDLRLIPFIFKLICDLLVSFFVLVREKPGVVVGFGGYTAGSAILIASLMGIKTIIHEQNCIPGRANIILDRFVDKVCVSFDESKKYFKNKRVVLTGNPLRKSIIFSEAADAHKYFGLVKNKFTVLIIGGSQGARSLNRLVYNAIIELGADMKKKLQILHITGPQDAEAVGEIYKNEKVSAKTFAFIDNIHKAYRIANLAISRSGAAAVFELALYGIPTILIPYPYEKNNQRSNAAYFSRHDACIYKEEKDLDSSKLKGIIEDLINDKTRQKRLSENVKKLSHPDAGKDLAREAFNLLGKL